MLRCEQNVGSFLGITADHMELSKHNETLALEAVAAHFKGYALHVGCWLQIDSTSCTCS